MADRELSGRGYDQGRADFDKGRTVAGWFESAKPTMHTADAWRAGWWSRWLQRFKEGADSADLPGADVNPHEHMSPAWEAWASGFEARHAREA